LLQRRSVHSAVIDILVVCTGNACRSPMAAAILQRHLDQSGVAARVSSAGTSPWGSGATGDAVTVMRERDLDIAAHSNRRLTTELLEHSDLVLGMTRDHVSFSLMRCPGAAGRVYLVGELARLGSKVGPRDPGEPVTGWIARVAATRPTDRPLGRAVDEVADPVGEPIDAYRATIARLDRDLTTVAALLAGRTLV
jgi:protein-tyrosine phosphatase